MDRDNSGCPSITTKLILLKVNTTYLRTVILTAAIVTVKLMFPNQPLNNFVLIIPETIKDISRKHQLDQYL